jgi:hypothetical protein
MQHDAWFKRMLPSTIGRTSTGQQKESAMRHWFRSGALVIGTALGLSLAGAPVARSAQTDNQLSIEAGNQLSFEAGEVIREITVGAITQRTCGGGSCACQGSQIATGGGAECVARDTLMVSAPSGSPANAWVARCQRLTEIRLPASVTTGGTTVTPVVVDIVRQDGVPPLMTHVICAGS